MGVNDEGEEVCEGKGLKEKQRKMVERGEERWHELREKGVREGEVERNCHRRRRRENRKGIERKCRETRSKEKRPEIEEVIRKDGVFSVELAKLKKEKVWQRKSKGE